MTTQPDLFGAGPEPTRRGVTALPLPARPAVAHFPTPPTLEWAKLLSAYPAPVIILASWLWSGVVLEVLSAGINGRWGVRADRKIISFPADIGCRARIIHMMPPAAADLHLTHRLIPLGSLGEVAGQYRFAEPHEVTPTLLELPGGSAKEVPT